MTESEVTIVSGEVSLAATLTLPSTDDPLPVVLCIHGTGPLDRNENFRPQALDVFNRFAEHLGSLGVATLRYDKRGCGSSTGDYHSAGQTELVADARSCLAYLHAHAAPRFSRCYLLGHSEGTIIAPRVSAAGGGVSGLILISPFVQDVETLLRAQAQHLDEVVAVMGGFNGFLARAISAIVGKPTRHQDALIDELKSTSKPVLRKWFRRVPAKSLRELMALDPREIFRAVDVPTLLVGGEKDVQCGPFDAHAIAEIIGPQATSHVVPDLTHILRKDTEPHTMLSYQKLLKHPLDREVLEIVGTWLVQQVQGTEPLAPASRDGPGTGQATFNRVTAD